MPLGASSGCRSRHRVDNDCRFLPLKLVNSSHLRAWQPICEPIDLVIVRSDDQDVVKGQGSLLAVAVGPGRSGLREDFNDLRRLARLLLPNSSGCLHG